MNSGKRATVAARATLFLFIVGRKIVLGEQMYDDFRRVRRFDLDERPRLLREVKGVFAGCVRAPVGGGKLTETEKILGEAQERWRFRTERA